MNQESRPDALLPSRRLIGTMGAFMAIGVIAFFAGLLWNPTRAWQIYLVNFLFWSGLAQGGVVFAAIYHVVGGKWGPSMQRLAQGMAAFLPVSLVLFSPLFFGMELFFDRVRALNPERGAWFDPRFIFVRGGLGLGLMTVLSLFFVYYSLRPQVGLSREQGVSSARWLDRWLTEEWQGYPAEAERCERGMDVLAAGVLLAYPITYTFMAFDLIMALDPFWYSSLFGGYFFISTFYLGLAGIAVVSVLAHRHLHIQGIGASQFSDLGKLLLGFNLTYLAMVWSQYIVIWYGNLPEETHFVVLRVWQRPWAPLSWSVFVMATVIPFLVFLSARAKRIPWIMLSMGLLIAVGLWIERYILVVPSLWPAESAPFGLIELGITAGFLGAMGLSYLFFLRNVPFPPSTLGTIAVSPGPSGANLSGR